MNVIFSEFSSLRKAGKTAWEAEVLPLNYARKRPNTHCILQSDGVTSHGRVVEERCRTVSGIQ